MAEYFNTLISDNLKVALTLERFENGLVKDLCNSIKYLFLMIIFPPWLRHYVPGFRQKNKEMLDHMFNQYHGIEREIVQKRRVKIKNTPIGQELTNDLLTQFCTANT